MTQASSDVPVVDCLVIGGGVAGLTAAVYLARYRRTLALVDAGASRLQWIPRSRNVLGQPDGIAGTALWQRLREHAARYGVEPQPHAVDTLRHLPAGGVFEAAAGPQRWRARRVLLCTGARDIEPAIDGLREGLAHGLVRYCPVCDGFETQHQRVAVLGPGLHGLREALFVAGFDNRVTWLSMGTRGALGADAADALERAAVCGLRIEDTPPLRLRCDLGQREVHAELPGGRALAFDTLYPALGQTHASELATALGARATADGQLQVDAHLQTTVPGLYAAGDVADGLNQISVAAGHAAIAATAVHNALRDGMTTW